MGDSALIFGRCCISAGIACVSSISTDFLASIPDVNGPKDVVGVMIRVETINSLVSLFWSPLMGGICDSFGRRRLLVVLPAFSAAARLLVATFPSRRSYIAYRIANAMALVPLVSTVIPSMLMDVHGRSTPEYTQRANNMSRAMTITRLTVSMLLGRLNKPSSRALYAAAGLCSLISTFAFASVPETLPPGKRKVFSFKTSANPLAFVDFFKLRSSNKVHRTRQLLALALALQSASCYNSTVDTFRKERFGEDEWNVAARARMSIVSEVLGIAESYVYEYILNFWVRMVAFSNPRKSGSHSLSDLAKVASYSQRVKAISTANSILAEKPRFLIANLLLDMVRSGPLALDRLLAAITTDEGNGNVSAALYSLEWPIRMIAPRLFQAAFSASMAMPGRLKLSGAFVLAMAIQMINAEVVLPLLSSAIKNT